MSKRIATIAVLLFVLFSASAQKKLNYVEIDKKSYALFQQKKWNELIAFSAESRKQGIDFFYLQARTGIAYYNLKKYRMATEWFLKAWENDRSFEWLQEYLYYSLVYDGRYSEALKLADNFTKQLQAKIGYSKSKALHVAVEGGYSFNPDFDKLTNGSLDEEAGVGDDYGEAFYMKNYNFESLDFRHQVLPGFNITHNFTYLTINREQQIDWGTRTIFPVQTQQFQYFINPEIVLGKKLHISPSVNVIWGNSDLFLSGVRNNYKYFYPAPQNYSDIIFSTSVWSHLGNFSPGAEINLANVSDNKFTQLSGWITYYPFANTNFYITPRIFFKADSENGFGYNTFEISGGGQLGPVHFYGQYLTGDMKNFIEAAGYVIANFPGKSDSKFLGSFYFPVGKKYQFVVRYINQSITETYQVYSNFVPVNSVEYNYYKHTFTGGILWRF
jgi:tetratricopeptide (TPR) repeat protein